MGVTFYYLTEEEIKEIGKDPLFRKVEAAIQLAARLGEDAFDFIEGRGLHLSRHEIAKEILEIRAGRL